ncbi:MAG: peptidylprolyl isomerase [Bdellovibrionota bacterium]
MKRFFLSAISLTSFSLFAANVAVVGGKKISKEEFNARYEQNKQLAVPGQTPSKEEVLNNIVNFELAIQEAKALGMDKDPMLKDQFEILLYKTLVQKQLKTKIDSQRISEAEMREYYNRNPLVKTRQIVFLVTPEMTSSDIAKVKARAEMVYGLLSSGKKKFTELVAEFSEGPDAKFGGLVDFAARNKLVPEYYEAALALKPGQHSNIVQSPYGMHIIQLEEIKAFPGVAALNPDYKNFITRTVKDFKGREIYEAYFSDLRKKYAVKTDTNSI